MAQNKNWFRRHPVWTGIIGFFVLIIIIGNIVPENKLEINQDVNSIESELKNNEINTLPQEEINNNEETKTYSNTQSGVTLILEDYKYTQIKEGYGKLDEITVSIINNGAEAIYPTLSLQIYDNEYNNKKEADITGLILSGETLSHQKVPIDLSIGGTNKEKDIKLALYDLSIYGDFIVSINFKKNFENQD